MSMQTRVCDLLPGDLMRLDTHEAAAVVMSVTDHPFHLTFKLVVWYITPYSKKRKPWFSFDCLLANQVLGGELDSERQPAMRHARWMNAGKP